MVAFDSGTTRSDNNAKWRLTNWRYASPEIRKQPLQCRKNPSYDVVRRFASILCVVPRMLAGEIRGRRVARLIQNVRDLPRRPARVHRQNPQVAQRLARRAVHLRRESDGAKFRVSVLRQ